MAWEVNEAERLNKRILPAVLPGRFQTRRSRSGCEGSIIFSSQSRRNFAAALDKLVQAILVDIGWVREHTRLLDLALHWETLGKQAANLLAGNDIERAEQWLMRAPLTEPSPSMLVRSFISQSREYRETTLASKASSLAASAGRRQTAAAITLWLPCLRLKRCATAEASGRQAPASAAQRTLYAAYQRNRELNVVFAHETSDETALSLPVAAFSPDGRTGLAYRWGTSGAVLWDGETGRRDRRIESGRHC